MNNTTRFIAPLLKWKSFAAILGLLMLTACGKPIPLKSHIERTFPESDVQEQTEKKESVPVNIPDSGERQPEHDFNRYHLPRIDVSVHEIDAREFFMGLVIDSNQNMIVHPDVSGRISLNLKSVTIPQILDIVQKVYGYDYKYSDIGYIIYPVTQQTRMFKIDRLDLLREGRSNTIVASAQNNLQNDSDSSNDSQNNSNSSQTQKTVASWVQTTTDTDFWQELEAALKVIVSLDEAASIVINRQSGLVIARAKPPQLREIEDFLNVTQKQISRQVILEAKILEVILNDGHKDGVDWKSIIREGLQTAPLLTGQPGAVFTLASRMGSFRAGDFTAVVELLETQGKTNVLSSPRISTLNNQKAIIKVGQDEYFITNVSSTSTTNTNNNFNTSSFPSATFESFFSGITLDVTPQINDNGEITLHIHPSISKTENLNKEFTIFGEDFSVPTALNTVRESDSIVKVRNGQVIVLGGLMHERKIDDKEGVTGFSRIPYLGRLFRVDTGNNEKSELIILLKASLIEDDSDWKTDMDKSRQRFEELESVPRWIRGF